MYCKTCPRSLKMSNVNSIRPAFKSEITFWIKSGKTASNTLRSLRVSSSFAELATRILEISYKDSNQRLILVSDYINHLQQLIRNLLQLLIHSLQLLIRLLQLMLDKISAKGFTLVKFVWLAVDAPLRTIVFSISLW